MPKRVQVGYFVNAGGDTGEFNVLAYKAQGNGTTDDRDAINNAATAATVSGGVMVLPAGTYKLSSSLSIPANVSIRPLEGAKFSIDSGQTLTILGNVEAKLHQIFSGAGSVSFAANNKLNKFYPEWWGAVGDGITDDTVALQSAVNAASPAKGTVFLHSTTYFVASTITIPSYIKIYGISAGEGIAGSIIKGDTGINIFSFASLGYVTIANLTFRGSGCNAIYQTNMANYCIHLTVHQCNFYAELTSCITANSIFGKIERSTFGYNGTPGATHNHIYFKGVGATASNFNKITDNRFYNARGYSCRFDTCYHLTLEGNNWELNGSQTGGTPDYDNLIEIAGVYALYVKNNWFEANIYTRMFYFTLETGSTYGTYMIEFTENHVSVSTYMSYIFTGSASPWRLHILYNAFISMSATEISSNDNNVITFFQNWFTAYTGTLSGVNKLAFTSPVIPTPTMSAQGWSKSAWMVGWSTTNLQNWLKGGTGNPTWVQTTVAGYQGNAIAFTTTAGGYNHAYITLPVEYFKGKTIMLRGLVSRDSGTASALALAYNTTEATPTSMTVVGSSFSSATLTDNKAYIDVPSDAAYLHVGFASGGWAGVSTIKAFDVWVVNTDELTVPTFSLGNSVVVADIPAMTSAEFAAKISDETGTDKIVFNTNPIFVTPNLGDATATSIAITGSTRKYTTKSIKFVKTILDIADNVATTVLTITTTDEATDGGGYTLILKALIGHSLTASTSYSAVKSYSANFSRIMGTGGTGANSAIVVIYDGASVATDPATRDIGTVTMSVVESTEFINNVQLTIDLTGTSVLTAQVVLEAELIWHAFLTPPVMS